MKKKIYSLAVVALSMGSLPTMATPVHPLPMMQENVAASENDLETAKAQLAVWQEKANQIVAAMSKNEIYRAADLMA